MTTCQQSLAPSGRLPDASISDDDDGAHGRRVARHLALLLDVLRSRRWSAFEAIVLSNPAVYRAVSEAMSSLSSSDGRDNHCPTLLHACLPHDPPPEIVLKLIATTTPDRRGASLLRARDRDGRTPLHVASACRDADPIVVKLLLDAYPAACAMLDARGRTPLHLACESPSYDVVRAHLSESIAPASIEDDDGMSPLEYAILSDASVEVVHLLQKATMLSHQERDVGPVTKKRGSPEVVVFSSASGIIDERIYEGFTGEGTKRRRVGVSVDDKRVPLLNK